MTKLLLYPILLLLPGFVFCQKNSIDLAEALAKNMIRLNVEGAGGHTGQSLILHVERLSNRAFDLRLPAGQIFLPADSAYQSLVVAKEELIALDRPKVFFKVFGKCIEAHDGSPGEGSAFTTGALAAGALLEICQYISTNKLYKEGDAQSAIWCITDSMPVATIGHKGLLATTCQLLGQPLPEYKINTNNAAPTRPRQAAYVYEPLSVEGEFTYQSNEERIINIYVLNEAGEKVRTIFENHRHPAGWARYSFYFKTTKLPRGNYEVCLDDGEKIVKKIKVRY